MRIGLDARLVTYRRGMGNFVYQLLCSLAKLPDQIEYVLYVADSEAARLIPAHPRIAVRLLRPRLYPIWEQISLVQAAAVDRLDILHCPANTGPVVSLASSKLILTIHDVMYLMPVSSLPLAPSLYQRLGRLYRRLVVPSAAKKAAALLTVSEHSRRDILAYLRDIPEPVVTLEAASPLFQRLDDQRRLAEIREKYALPGKFMLSLGATDPRKNTAGVLVAFERLKSRTSERYQLMLVGLPRSAQRPLWKLAQTLGIAQEVVMSGFVPEDDLVALYNAAELLVYPSLYEGFGLPVLEAMACGTPVITSPTGSIPEVAGDAVLWVDPRSSDAISQGMQRILTDRSLADRFRLLGLERASQFSWDTVADKVLNVYREVMQS